MDLQYELHLPPQTSQPSQLQPIQCQSSLQAQVAQPPQHHQLIETESDTIFGPQPQRPGQFSSFRIWLNQTPPVPYWVRQASPNERPIPGLKPPVESHKKPHKVIHERPHEAQDDLDAYWMDYFTLKAERCRNGDSPCDPEVCEDAAEAQEAAQLTIVHREDDGGEYFHDYYVDLDWLMACDLQELMRKHDKAEEERFAVPGAWPRHDDQKKVEPPQIPTSTCFTGLDVLKLALNLFGMFLTGYCCILTALRIWNSLDLVVLVAMLALYRLLKHLRVWIALNNEE